MREFKFRAWENGKMYYQVRCGGLFDEIPTAPTVWDENKRDWVNMTGQPYTEVMQYTGLKDKNGKEIYEGDIIQDPRRTKYIKTVVWHDGGFQALYKFTRKYQGEEWEETNILPIHPNAYEVIGNIYDNPNLV